MSAHISSFGQHSTCICPTKKIFPSVCLLSFVLGKRREDKTMTPSFLFVTTPLIYNNAATESFKERTNKGNNEWKHEHALLYLSLLSWFSSLVLFVSLSFHLFLAACATGSWISVLFSLNLFVWPAYPGQLQMLFGPFINLRNGLTLIPFKYSWSEPPAWLSIH